MKDNIARGVASICFLALCTPAPMASQEPTIRVQSSLVLVDVLGQDRKSGLPVRDFKREDFRLFDNRHEVTNWDLFLLRSTANVMSSKSNSRKQGKRDITEFA